MSVKTRFCPKCGKETKNLVKGLCEECFHERTPIGKVPDEIGIQVCPKCGRYLKDNRWVKQSYLKGVLKQIVKKALNFKGYGSIKTMIEDDLQEARVKVSWYVDETQQTPIDATYEIPIKIQKRLCDMCFRRFSGYYVSVIQLRGDEDKVQRAIEKIKELEDRREMWFITKAEDTRGGVDIQVGSKDMDREIEKILKKEAAEIKRSYSLITKKDGNDVYRNTILVRL